jgi:uncharacterized protein (DUF952 family)
LTKQPIYHLVPASYYESQAANRPYTPATFADEGFVHCTAGENMMVEVANTYFSNLAEPLFALRIDPEQLHAPLRFEPPIPPGQKAPSTKASDASDILFPHIYGPINREAIADCLTLERDDLGQWHLP